MVRSVGLKTLPILAMVAWAPAPAWAQEDSGNWQWRATVYGWLPDIEGKTAFRTGAGGPTLTIDASTLVDNLDFTFQAGLQVRKGEWGAFTDLIYLDEGAARSGVRDITIGPAALPSGASYDLVYDMKSWIWTVAGTYNLASSDAHTVDVLFGARMLDIDQALAWTAQGEIGPIEPPARSGSGEISLKNWDAVVGVKGLSRLGSEGRWVVPWYVDLGTGDTDLTVQALAGIGYSFGWGEVLAAWRYLDYDLAGGDAVTDLNFSGPLVGVAIDW